MKKPIKRWLCVSRILVAIQHGRKGLKKMVLGSVAQSVLGEIQIPVLVVRG